MRVLIGTYRGKKHVGDALRSLERHCRGITDLIFVNDSPNPDDGTWLTQYGKVVEVGGKGYTHAMHAACQAAEGHEIFWLEEDFELLSSVNLPHLSEVLYHRPYLAQIALLRGPHFPVEHHHGGLIEALQAKGHTFTDVAGLIEHTSVFTCNPSVWRADVTNAGWPQRGGYTEEVKRDHLLRRGYRFAYLPGIRCAHHGEREGFGYRV